MKLIQSLREHLIAKVEHLRSNPDRLIISVDKGQMQWRGSGLSHRQDYVATVEIDSWPEHLDSNHVFVPLLDWYQNNQDPRPANSKSPIRYETYVLSNGSTTVVLEIDLEELVVASILPDGSYQFDVCQVA